MGRIRVLDDTLASQIAAGEVVERPASVVKELVENALDAGATMVTVEIVGGGLERIRVVDNGHGMSPEDAPLAVERHATSKLRTSEDLWHIKSLGFRGEALASIASVSRFALRTREPDAVGATCIRVEGGRGLRVESEAGPAGTELRVDDLFFNVPARRKFLRKPETEAAHAQDVVTHLAIAHPEVGFRLLRDGRQSLDLPRGTDLIDRLRAMFGAGTASALYPVVVDGPFRLDGYVGAPKAARATPRHYHLFVNGRHVRDRVLINAVRAGYADALPPRRHPFVVLRLTIPPEGVDVNVHPAKTEVRFVDSGAIHRLVARGVGEVARQTPWATPDESASKTPEAMPAARSYDIPAVSPPPSASQTSSPGLDAHRRRVFDVLGRLNARRGESGANPAARPALPAHQRGADGPRSPRTAAIETQTQLPIPEPPSARPVQPADPRADAPTPTSRPPDRLPCVVQPGGHPVIPFGSLQPIALMGQGLCCCQAADALVVLDVNAARERLALDRYGHHASPPSTRPVAPPCTLACSRTDFDTAVAAQGMLGSLGFELEPFGGTTLALKGVPEGLEGADPSELLTELIEQLRGSSGSDGDRRRMATAICARWAARNAGVMALSDAGSLLESLEARRPTTMAHRPYYFVLPLADAHAKMVGDPDRMSGEDTP